MMDNRNPILSLFYSIYYWCDGADIQKSQTTLSNETEKLNLIALLAYAQQQQRIQIKNK